MRPAPTRQHRPIRPHSATSGHCRIPLSVDGSLTAGKGANPAILEDMPAEVSLGPSTPPPRTGSSADAADPPGDRPRRALTMATIVVSISVVLGVRAVS